MEPIWVVAIVTAGTIISPAVLSWLNGRQRRKDKQQDYARQDAVAEKAERVAARVAEAAKLLLQSNEDVARTAETAARTAAETQSQLHQIHDLVNSNLTAAIRDSYTSKVGHLAALRERESVLAESGKPPTPGAARVMRELQASIDELGTTIADRLDATKVAARSAEG